MKKNSHYILFFLLILISTLLHYGHFNKELVGHHVWRQTQTQSTINNFYEEDMNILNPRKNDRGNESGIFRMEFPLMQWSVACLYKIFGKHLIITRLFMFFIGILSVIGIYFLLFQLFHRKILAMIGAWAFGFSPSFFYFTINPIPDNLALCFSIWGLVFLYRWLETKSDLHLTATGLLLSLGAACKLPFILYYIIPIAIFGKAVIHSINRIKSLKQSFLFFSFSVIPLGWYVYVIPSWKADGILNGITDKEESWTQIIDIFIHNLISTLPELLLNYGAVAFFILGFFFLWKNKAYRNNKFTPLFYLSILLSLFFFYEINMIDKIHDYYLFPFFPLLFMLVGYGGYCFYKSRLQWSTGITLLIMIILPFTCYLRLKDRWNINSPGFNKDLLLYQNELRDAVPDDALVIAGNDISHYIFFYYINKKGWAFHKNKISKDEILTMIEEGATYLYSDSEFIRENEEIDALLEKEILRKGSISIFKLKRKAN